MRQNPYPCGLTANSIVGPIMSKTILIYNRYSDGWAMAMRLLTRVCDKQPPTALFLAVSSFSYFAFKSSRSVLSRF